MARGALAGGPPRLGVGAPTETGAAGAAGLAVGRLGKVMPPPFEAPIFCVGSSELCASALARPGAAAPAAGREGAPFELLAVRSHPLQSGQRLCTGLKSLLQAGQCMNRLLQNELTFDVAIQFHIFA